MSKKGIKQSVKEMLQSFLDENDYELFDIEFKKEAGSWVLRVYIDSLKGISIDDCQKVSEFLSESLDQVDLIKQSYVLEVSSPGIDRPLKKDQDFERFKGETVDIKLYESKNGKKLFKGQLEGLFEGIIKIKDEDGNILEFSRQEVASVKLSVEF
ncbi:MAG: ribosome maturation factor RimP [Clostridia bacterium]|nr:ribosome maturation factor RimP [Clostridia bacterium]